MAQLIRIIGTQRGGTHAFLNWLVRFYERNQYAIRTFADSGPELVEELAFFIPPNGVINAEDKRVIIYMTNNRNISAFNEVPANICESYDVRNILLLRDPYNLFASQFRAPPQICNRPDVNSYLGYCYEYTGGTSYLGEKMCVSYNQWLVDTIYRKSIIEELGLKFNETDDVDAKMSMAHPGSSFEQGEKAPEPENLLTRWKYYSGTREYLAYFKNKKIVEFSKEIFDLEPDLANTEPVTLGESSGNMVPPQRPARPIPPARPANRPLPPRPTRSPY